MFLYLPVALTSINVLIPVASASPSACSRLFGVGAAS